MRAFIGTREFDRLPDRVQFTYYARVEVAVIDGETIRTGAAVGADQAAAVLALRLGGAVALVLPWKSYEQAWVEFIQQEYPGQVSIEVYDPRQHPLWTDSVATYHPAPARLSRGAFALHARNYGIISPAAAVVAVPSTKPGGGGTGQGIRIARALGIPLEVIDATA